MYIQQLFSTSQVLTGSLFTVYYSIQAYSNIQQAHAYIFFSLPFLAKLQDGPLNGLPSTVWAVSTGNGHACADNGGGALSVINDNSQH